MKTTKTSLAFLAALSLCLTSCNSGGGSNDGLNGSSINTQPSNSNYVNYFPSYPMGDTYANTPIYQLRYVNKVPTQLAIFNSFGYIPASNNPISLLNLTPLADANNYSITGTSSTGSTYSAGFVSLINSGNTIVVELNMQTSLSTLMNGEQATIQIAGKTVTSQLAMGNYYGHCFNLPAKNNLTTQGNDICKITFSNTSGNSVQITDLAVNGVIGNQAAMCLNGSNFSTNILNPYETQVNCLTAKGNVNINVSTTPFKDSSILTYYVSGSYSGVPGTSSVSTAFPESTVQAAVAGNSLHVMNLTTVNNYTLNTALLSTNLMVNPYCSANSQLGQYCTLLQYPNTTAPVNLFTFGIGASSVGGNISFLGSASLGLYTDNNGYSYYF